MDTDYKISHPAEWQTARDCATAPLSCGCTDQRLSPVLSCYKVRSTCFHCNPCIPLSHWVEFSEVKGLSLEKLNESQFSYCACNFTFNTALIFLVITLTSWNRVATSCLSTQEIPCLVLDTTFITACLHPESDNPVHHFTPLSLRLILTSSHLCLGLPSGVFPSGFLARTLYMVDVLPQSSSIDHHNSVWWRV